MSELNNPLLRKSTRFGYYSALDENTVQDPVDPDPREGSDRYKETVSRSLYGAGSMVGRQDYVVGDDGNYYNEDGERVYYWVRPRETDSTMRDYGTEEMSIGQDMGGYYTEAEIRGAWDADEGMGYFKEQTDWDNYWGYLTERQGLIQSGDLPDPTRPEYMDAFPAADVGEAPTPNVGSSFGGGRDEEIYYAQEAAAGAEARNAAMAAFVDANSGLMQKYGISPSFQNKDGDTFMFNGSTYVRTDKVDDSFDVAGFVGGLALSALTAGAAAFLAPALAGAIGVSNTIAKALITAALDLAQGNDLDIGTALGLVGGDILPGGVTLDELGAADDAVQSAIDAVVDELTDPDNYREDDANNTIVWGGHGGTDEVGNPVINLPNFEPITEDEEDEGGATTDSTDTTSDPAPDEGAEEPVVEEPVVEVPPEMTDPIVPDWVYEGGVWVNQETGERVTGPGEEGDEMTHEEMGDAWGTGDYEWDTEDPVDDVAEVPEEEEEIIIDLPEIEIPVEPVDPVEPVEPADPTPPADPSTPADPGGSGGTGGGGTGGDGDPGGEEPGGEEPGQEPGGEQPLGDEPLFGEDPYGDAGSGGGEGRGDGEGDGRRGMMSGGDYTPQWGELFAYTTLTPYQKQELEPYRDYIKPARGMLS